jgi:universal stress protein A
VNENSLATEDRIPEGEGLLNVAKILVPLDFFEPSKNALRYAVQFAAKFDAKLVVLHVVEPAFYPSDYGYAAVESGGLVAETKAQLDAIAAEINPATLIQERLVRIGKPFRVITEAATEYEADLIIIATHGYSHLRYAVLGGTAERVVRHAPCPVLVLRQREHVTS